MSASRGIAELIGRLAEHTRARIGPIVGVDASQHSSSFEQLFIRPRLATVKGESIGIDELLQQTRRAVIIGSFGSGKTTVLNYLALKSANEFFTQPKERAVPVFLPARRISSGVGDSGIIARIALLLSSDIGMDVTGEVLTECFSQARISLFIDGLDEVPTRSDRLDVATRLNDLARAYPNLQLILASRPSALTVPFDGFSYYNLGEFDEEQTKESVRILANLSPEKAEQFAAALVSHPTLSVLSSNPLMLSLLWNVFEAKGALPANQASLYNDFTEILLSKRLTGKQSLPGRFSLHQKTHILEQLAVHLTQHGLTSLSLSELYRIAGEVLGENGSRDAAVDAVTEITSTGLLAEVARGQWAFVHLSFAEYFTALAIIDDPERLKQCITRPHLHSIVVLACGMTHDIAPIIESAVAAKEIVLAAKCISNSRTKNQRLAEYVISSLLNEVEGPFTGFLAEYLVKYTQSPSHGDAHTALLNLWDSAICEGLTSQEKGLRFEEFAKAFFGEFFEIVSHDLNTENGEIDLIVEVRKNDPFWNDFGGEALVECKNWDSKRPLKEIGAFAHKAASARGVKLGFFVSVSGFTEDAIRTVKNQAADLSKPLIVPLAGDEIKQALIRKDDFEEFFKEAIRRMKYLRKY